MKKETIASFEEDGILNMERVISGYNAYIYKILRNSISNEADKNNLEESNLTIKDNISDEQSTITIENKK